MYKMKASIKLLAIALVLLGFGLGGNAQSNTATATATGTLVSALTISGSGTLSFGRIVAGTAGTVSVAGVPAPSPQSALGLAGGTVTSARFTISGADGAQYVVTLPSAAVRVNHSDGTNWMEVSSFSCDVATPGTSVAGTTASGTLSGTSRTFYVGGTLNVKTGDPIGTYTSATFPVTVSYQ
jgi:hypothetical protein